MYTSKVALIIIYQIVVRYTIVISIIKLVVVRLNS